MKMADKKTEAQIVQENLDALKDHQDTAEEQALVHAVDETRITLVDDQDEEYEYMILDEFDWEGKTYLALASCDEKNEGSGSLDANEMDDITVVRKFGEGDNISFGAVTDEHELLAVSRIISDKYEHLMGGIPE